jgi:type IV pilus assembly protein PilW
VSTAKRQRGFTLTELLISAATTSVVLAGVVAVIVGVNGSFQSNVSSQQAQEHGRAALTYVERTLPTAGYGLRPEQAFDFTTTGLPGGTKDNYTPGSPPDWGTFTTDDLAFRYRDPYFLRRGSVANLSGPDYIFSLDTTDGSPATLGRAFSAGEVVQLACVASQGSFLGRVKAAALGTDASLMLEAREGAATPPECIKQEGTFLMRVHEKRIRVMGIGATPAEQRPYLVVFHDWNTPVESNPNYDPIAAEVESFQVSYQMNRPQAGSTVVPTPAVVDSATNKNWILGDDGLSNDLLPDPSAPAPTYETPYDHARRYNAHPANIRAVRIGLAVRAPRANADRPPRDTYRLANHQFPAAPDNFARMVVDTVVRVPNIASRTFFTPSHRNAIDMYDRRNVWGG